MPNYSLRIPIRGLRFADEDDADTFPTGFLDACEPGCGAVAACPSFTVEAEGPWFSFPALVDRCKWRTGSGASSSKILTSRAPLLMAAEEEKDSLGDFLCGEESCRSGGSFAATFFSDAVIASVSFAWWRWR